MTAVHQFVPVLAGADAVGTHTLLLRRALRDAGFESDVYADVIHDEVRGEARPYAEYARRGGADLLLYQCSTGSPLTAFLLERPEPLAVDYHNITPASFFERWEPEAALNMRRARTELRRLAPRAAMAVADSPFNAAELEAAGFAPPVHVAPPLLDLPAVSVAPDPATLAVLRRTRRGAHWLFVGRLAPNKCQHDLVAALAAARRLHDPGARLTLVGSATSEVYRDALEAMADDLGVADAVTFADRVRPDQLAAYYADADVFVCLSEHEGFCVPVVEAMHLGVPVVAYAAAAVPDTVGDAGVLLDGKDPVLVATAVHRLLADPSRRDDLARAGKGRSAEFSAEVTTPRLVELVRSFVEGRAARA